jgi:metal-responsive CopG/Arc/MetJ family transcriptional regulator
MPLSPGNKQISVVLPQIIVDLLDKEAADHFFTRSQQASRIIIDYLVDHHKKEDSK